MDAHHSRKAAAITILGMIVDIIVRVITGTNGRTTAQYRRRKAPSDASS